MLGHDVEYFNSVDDSKLITLAKNGNRVLLTRDQKLFQRAVSRGAQAVLVDGSDEAEKLALLASRFGFKLEIDLTVSRCPKCNARLEAVSKNDVLEQIPERTAIYYEQFWRCTGCGKIYWRGSHWKNIEATLEHTRALL